MPTTTSLLLAALLPLTALQHDLPSPNPDAQGIYHVAKDLVTVPKLVYIVEPEFSEKARKLKIAGNTKIKFIVGIDGLPHNLTVIQSAGDAYPNPKDKKHRVAAATLDPKAIEAVQSYRFEPAQYQGRPVPCWMTVEVNFQLF